MIIAAQPKLVTLSPALLFDSIMRRGRRGYRPGQNAAKAVTGACRRKDGRRRRRCLSAAPHQLSAGRGIHADDRFASGRSTRRASASATQEAFACAGAGRVQRRRRSSASRRTIASVPERACVASERRAVLDGAVGDAVRVEVVGVSAELTW